MIRNFMVLMLLTAFFFVAPPGHAADVGELERRIDMMSDEIDRLKSSGGSGGGVAHATTIHGYGESHVTFDSANRTKMDQHRFVIGVHSELADWIHLNAEIDFEHAAQTLEYEFGYLDFLLSDKLNFRAGVMLMPMGNLNENHEPPLFYSVERDDFHVKLIPSTWQQMGVGAFGRLAEGINYRVYFTNAVRALDNNAGASKFGNGQFIRDGREQQKGYYYDDLAISGRLEHQKISGLDLGFSFYTANSTNGYIDDGGRLTILVADAKYQMGAYDFDLGIFKGFVNDTAEMNTWCGAGDAKDSSEGHCIADIPKSAFGWTLTAGAHLPQIMKWRTTHDLVAFARYNLIRPNDEVGDNDVSADRKKNFESVTVGLSYMPINKVALKVDYQQYFYKGERLNPQTERTQAQKVNLGVAYMY